MKRIKLEVSTRGWEKFGYASLIEVVERAEAIGHFILTKETYVFLWRVSFKPGRTPEELKGRFGIDNVSVIKDNGEKTLIVYGKFLGFLKKFYYDYSTSFEYPLLLEKDRMAFTIVGEEENLKRCLAYLKRNDLEFKILSVSPYQFGKISLLDALTERQRTCLLLAYNEGFYEIPRQCSSKEMAHRLGITHQAFIENLRKAERKIMGQILG
jgi:hypothetical protein